MIIARDILRKHEDSINEAHHCGCQFSLFNEPANIGLVVKGDRTCVMQAGHATVYKPSAATIESGLAVSRYNELKRALLTVTHDRLLR